VIVGPAVVETITCYCGQRADHVRADEVETINYFAYGHNTNTHIMKERCPSAKLLGKGVLKNFKLVFRHYADLENEDDTQCYGILWRVNTKDLKELDHDEGLHKAYNRVPVQIDTEHGPVRAMTYIMDPTHKNKPDTPEWYVESCEEGYTEHGLPLEQIENAPKDVSSNQELHEAGGLPTYYFSYGMLCDPNNMEGIHLIGVAELRNFEYVMYQYANVEPHSGSKVYGCLWEVDRRIISQLDQVEGYPELYDRRTYPVYCDGEKYVAEVYVMTPYTLRRVQGTVPSRQYIQMVKIGYSHAGVPLHQLYDALDMLDDHKHHGYQDDHDDQDYDTWGNNSYLDVDDSDDDNGDWDPARRGHSYVQNETVSTGLGGGSAGNSGGAMVGGPTTYEQEHQYTKHHGRGQRRTLASTYESVGNQTITLSDIYDGAYPDHDEMIWNFVGDNDFDIPFTVHTIQPFVLEQVLSNQYGVDDLEDLFYKMQPEQEAIVSDYQNNPNLSQQIIVLAGDRIIDGHHRALAAAMSHKPIKYVDVNEEA